MDKILLYRKIISKFDQYLNLEILQSYIWFGSPIEDFYPLNFDISTSTILSVYKHDYWPLQRALSGASEKIIKYNKSYYVVNRSFIRISEKASETYKA